MAPKDDTFNHSGWWMACTERSRSVGGGWWMACTVGVSLPEAMRSRWRWRSLPEAQPAVGIVWVACDLREVVGVASPLAIVRRSVDSLHPLSS